MYGKYCIYKKYFITLQPKHKRKEIMASIKNLKKDIHNVLGDILDATFFTGKYETEKGKALIGDIFSTFDEYLSKISDRKVEKRGTYLKQLRADFAKKAGKLIAELNAL